MPLISGTSRMAGNDPRPISFGQQPGLSEIDPFATPRTSNASQSRGSMQRSTTRKPGPRPAPSIDSCTSNPQSVGVFEVEAPHCTPEGRRIVKNRLMEIEGSGPWASSGDLLKSLKRLSLSRGKGNQNGHGQFSLSTLATGLERATE